MATQHQKINPAILQPLKEALSLAFWYKRDLRVFLSITLPDVGLVAHLDWTDYKRNIVHELIDMMAKNQTQYRDELLSLILTTSEISDPSHLKRLEDGQRKYEEAVAALATLRSQADPYRRLRSEADETERRRREEEAKAEVQRAVRERLADLKRLLYDLTAEADHQKRGYALEKLLNQLCALFDIDAKAPFKIVGEQIDGAFTFEGTEFLFEAKWTKEPSKVSDLDAFTGKISRKLDNTLGLFLSVNGFAPSALELFSQARPQLILMDGSDLSAVVEDRIELPELLTRKRQHASRTGAVFISAYTLLA